MESMEARLANANKLLAAYAVPLQGKLGRVVPEPPDETRNPFQRDRDRIIHAQSFRRLQGKTQVFVAGEGDHYRTRLTHTMEVAQLSRDIARTMELNEDLAECIALAHDLGHPPFAHMGEVTLDGWMKEHGSTFEHNEQSLRIVTTLEEHSSKYLGLNLNKEVLDGLRKHGRAETDPPTSEAQSVDFADEIAYCAHDCDDGLRAGLFAMNDLSSLALVASALVQSNERGTSLRGALIHLLVMDLYASSTESTVTFSAAMRNDLNALRAFLNKRMYAHPKVLAASAQGQEVLQALCDKFFEDPPQKVLDLQERTGSPLPIAIKDYVAGMTDAYARSML